jgi:hypothetical protein
MGQVLGLRLARMVSSDISSEKRKVCPKRGSFSTLA